MAESTPDDQGALRGCDSCGKFTRRNVTACPYCNTPLPALNRPNVFSGLFGAETITYLILGACIIGYIAEYLLTQYLKQLGPDEPFNLMNIGSISRTAYLLMGSNLNRLILENKQVWRLLTACFLHANLLHIFFNGMALRTLGQLVEPLWGKARFWVAFVATGIFSSAVSVAYREWTFSPTDFPGFNLIYSPVASLGASGAICGLLGIMYGFGLRHGEKVSREWRSTTKRWIIMILAFGFLVGGIDNAAHIGGLLSGTLFGYAVPPLIVRKQTVNERRIWNTLAVVCTLVVLVCVACAGMFFLNYMMASNAQT